MKKEQLEIVSHARAYSVIKDCKATADWYLGMISTDAIGAALTPDQGKTLEDD